MILRIPIGCADKKRALVYRGVIIRLVLLLLIYAMAEEFGLYFMPEDTVHDDFKYIQCAKYYVEQSSSLWDYNAFADAAASVRQYVSINNENFWFIYNCILMKIFRGEYIIRLLNILYAGISIGLLYDLTERLYDNESAVKAAGLLAYMPYPVVFCCFPFKDQFVMMILLYFFNFVWKYKENKCSVKDYIIIALHITVIHFTRSGLDMMMIAFIGLYVIIDSFRRNRLNFKTISIIIMLAFVLMVGGSALLGKVIYKLGSYLGGRNYSGSRIMRYMAISSPLDVIKLPFSYAIVALLPVDFNVSIKTWYGMIARINVIAIPIVLGNVVQMIKKKTDMVFYWGTMFFYFSTLIMSTMIYRHYFCLLPISYMHFSYYWNRENRSFKQAIGLASIILGIACVLYF